MLEQNYIQDHYWYYITLWSASNHTAAYNQDHVWYSNNTRAIWIHCSMFSRGIHPPEAM